MKMNPKAMKAVLEALRDKCLDDMADDKSTSEEKVAEAVEETEEEGGMAEAMEDVEGEEMAAEEPAEDEDEVTASLREFMKTKAPKPPRPGTAVMIAVEDKKKVAPPMKKKSIKDLMNG